GSVVPLDSAAGAVPRITSVVVRTSSARGYRRNNVSVTTATTTAVSVKLNAEKVVVETGMRPTWASMKCFGVAMRSGADPERPACHVHVDPKYPAATASR